MVYSVSLLHSIKILSLWNLQYLFRTLKHKILKLVLVCGPNRSLQSCWAKSILGSTMVYISQRLQFTYLIWPYGWVRIFFCVLSHSLNFDMNPWVLMQVYAVSRRLFFSWYESVDPLNFVLQLACVLQFTSGVGSSWFNFPLVKRISHSQKKKFQLTLVIQHYLTF